MTHNLKANRVSHAAMILALLASPAVAQEETTLYHGFSLVEPSDQTITADAFIVTQGDIIIAQGQGDYPAGDYSAIHDMQDQWALPGFIDAHAHLTAGPHRVEMRETGPAVTIDSVDQITRYNARMALAFGVTTVRNPGADPEASAAYDLAIENGEWIGPDALHAGAVIQPPPFVGTAFAYPQTPDEWQAEAARQAALGMTYFKLYHSLTEDEVAAGVEAAHANDLQAIAHLDRVSWTRAIELGVDGLLHALPTSPDLLEPEYRDAYLAELGQDSRFMYLWFEYADFEGPLIQTMIASLVENNVSVDLTLLVNLLVTRRDAVSEMFSAENRPYFHPESLAAAEGMMAMSGYGWSDVDYARSEIAMGKVHEFARRLVEAGVSVLIGTDGNGGGPLYARELQEHVTAGLDTWTVLDMATGRAAQTLGLGDRTGRLQPGLEADIVFLGANPVTDIGNTRAVTAVVTNGDFHTFEALTANLAGQDMEQ
jgi:imidazolonepropionase-like amidohydrolase